MALNIKNATVERLAADVAVLANESKTEAIRRALMERKERFMAHRLKAGKEERLEALLRNRIWPQIPRMCAGVVSPSDSAKPSWDMAPRVSR